MYTLVDIINVKAVVRLFAVGGEAALITLLGG